MYKYFLYFLFSMTGYGLSLSENYTYKSTIIYSTDLFPEINQKFEILKIPDHKFVYRIDALVIAKTFELNGIIIDTGKIRVVNFTKESLADLTTLKLQMTKQLLEHYPALQIEEITITPRGYMSLPKEVRIILDEHFFLNHKGIFYVQDETGLRRYLDYDIKAILPILHTLHKVDRKEKLSGMNTILKPVIFTSYKDLPLTQYPDGMYRFKTNLKQNTILTQRNIEPFPLVQKNEKVMVEVKSEAVIIEFGATAIQEGSLYDIITIQKSDGKRAKAKVIGENRVELL